MTVSDFMGWVEGHFGAALVIMFLFSVLSFAGLGYFIWLLVGRLAGHG